MHKPPTKKVAKDFSDALKSSKYHHLSYETRLAIGRNLNENIRIRDIAQRCDRHRSTIYREMRRGMKNKIYDPDFSHKRAQKNLKIKPKFTKLDDLTDQKIVKLIDKNWSPEQISHELKKNGILVSHETIYQWIFDEKLSDKNAYKHLRRKKSYRRKRLENSQDKTKIPNRTSIESRPKIVNENVEFGHWEADTVLGKVGSGAILSLTERLTKKQYFIWMPNKESVTTIGEIKNVAKQFPKGVFKTITFDNGTEFTNHEELIRELGIQTYFAHPYSPQERGLNENQNGLFRQYVPKGTDLRELESTKIEEFTHELNGRIRKILGWKSPTEIFQFHLNLFVALVP